LPESRILAGYQVTFLCLAFIGIINLIYFYFFVRERSWPRSL